MATLVPRLRPGVDVRTLPLDPTDGFVLTRVDGQTTVHAIASMTGLPEFSVESSVEKLVKLGAVEMYDPTAPYVPPAPVSSPAVGIGAQAPRPVTAPTAGREQRYPDSELEEACDLDMEHKRQILDLFYDLEDLDHYTLLGLTREADKKTIKRAYYDLASRLHPDRFFRKQLGSFKSKMEVVFAKITLAHDTLTAKEKREEYDVYLRDVVNTRSLEAQLARAQNEVRLAKEHAAAQEAHAEAQRVERARAEAAAAPVAEPEPVRPINNDAELRARREALARRLGKPAGQAAAPPPPRPEPPRDDGARGRSVQENRDTVKRMFDDRMNAAKRAQIARYIELARTSLASNDPVAASNTLRTALTIDPDDAELRALYDETEGKAAGVLVESYVKAAQYEERNERFPEAARSWARVAQLRPTDAVAADAAARCMLAGRGNLHQAADLSKHAITVAPNVTKYRITLANVYLAANLVLAAKRELEVAAKMDPKNQVVLEMLKRLPRTA